jgi:chorismate mutase
MKDIVKRLRKLYVDNGTNYVQEAADLIETLRAKVAELDKLAVAISRDCNDTANERNALRDELAALKAWRGEPIAWLSHNDEPSIYDAVRWQKTERHTIPLYTQAPTIPEGYFLAKRYWCNKCGKSSTTQIHDGCDYMALDMATPQPRKNHE